MSNNKTVRTLGMVAQDVEVEAGRSLYVKVQNGLDTKTFPNNNNFKIHRNFKRNIFGIVNCIYSFTVSLIPPLSQ